MNKLVTILIIALFGINNVLSAEASSTSCSYQTGNLVWHCSNNSPGTNIEPGQSGEITFYCCVTGPSLNESDNFRLIVDEVFNYTHSVQQQDYTWNTETIIYPATQFITSIDHPVNVSANTDIPVIVHFTFPVENEVYAAGKVLHARTDIQLDTGSAFVLNNVIDMRIVIPQDWTPSTFTLVKAFLSENFIIIGIGAVVIVAIGYFSIKKKRVTHKE
ncbi:Uncharacterised protein [Candidatus Tiddalikarchaeum anstoanum]|nr:Uncharacterised protein [Candidatus Tiddalikarchaeum anstoanum]